MYIQNPIWLTRVVRVAENLEQVIINPRMSHNFLALHMCLLRGCLYRGFRVVACAHSFNFARRTDKSIQLLLSRNYPIYYNYITLIITPNCVEVPQTIILHRVSEN